MHYEACMLLDHSDLNRILTAAYHMTCCGGIVAYTHASVHSEGEGGCMKLEILPTLQVTLLLIFPADMTGPACMNRVLA